jgi:hypothetical protein
LQHELVMVASQVGITAQQSCPARMPAPEKHATAGAAVQERIAMNISSANFLRRAILRTIPTSRIMNSVLRDCDLHHRCAGCVALDLWCKGEWCKRSQRLPGRGALKAGEGDEVDAAIVFDRDKCVAFDFPRFEETRIGIGENLVAIAGMRDKFERALRHGRDERVHDGELQHAGGQDSDRAIRCYKALLRNNTPEPSFQSAKEKDFCAASIWSIGCRADAPDWFEWIAYRPDARCPGGTQNRAQHQWKHMHVLMRVDVREAQAVTLQQGNLRGCFRLDLRNADPRRIQALEELADRGKESTRSAVHDGRDTLRVRRWASVDQDDVAADAKGGHGKRHLHGFFCSCGPGHKRRAGEDLSSVKLEDGAIDSGRHPEIVGVDDKAGHGDSLSIPREKRFAMWWMAATENRAC